MKRETYRPGPCGEARLDESTLVFVREVAHPPAAVWRALTEPASLREWAPFDADRDLGTTGRAELSMEGEPPAVVEVRRADPPRLLEYTWEGDLVRWELEPTAKGTRLTLRHTLADREWAAKVAAGWHITLDVAEELLAGTPIGRIVGEAAKGFEHERLTADYEARLTGRR